jgi:hypothetical protein
MVSQVSPKAIPQTVACSQGTAVSIPRTNMDGWNYAFRVYRPQPSVLDGTWQLPGIQTIDTA